MADPATQGMVLRGTMPPPPPPMGLAQVAQPPAPPAPSLLSRLASVLPTTQDGININNAVASGAGRLGSAVVGAIPQPIKDAASDAATQFNQGNLLAAAGAGTRAVGLGGLALGAAPFTLAADLGQPVYSAGQSAAQGVRDFAAHLTGTQPSAAGLGMRPTIAPTSPLAATPDPATLTQVAQPAPPAAGTPLPGFTPSSFQARIVNQSIGSNVVDPIRAAFDKAGQVMPAQIPQDGGNIPTQNGWDFNPPTVGPGGTPGVAPTPGGPQLVEGSYNLGRGMPARSSAPLSATAPASGGKAGAPPSADDQFNQAVQQALSTLPPAAAMQVVDGLVRSRQGLETTAAMRAKNVRDQSDYQDLITTRDKAVKAANSDKTLTEKDRQIAIDRAYGDYARTKALYDGHGAAIMQGLQAGAGLPQYNTSPDQ